MAYRIVIVRTMAEFITRILDFSKEVPDIWYRGEKYHKYRVEPSAYRYSNFRSNSRQIEKKSIMAARSNMLHIPETQRLSLDLDWLCYLQHSGTPTRLLDWSFEFQVALYFAFEDYVKGKAIPGSLPCVWGFRPMKFMESLKKYLTTKSKPFDLSSRQKEQLLSEVLLDHEPKDTNFISHYDKASPGLLNRVYIPLFSPFVNERAKLQGGCFIRFPLLKKKSFNFDQYRLDTFINSDSCFNDCLAKFIFINPASLREELSMLNLSTSRIYPEVENIALGIRKHIFEPKK